MTCTLFNSPAPRRTCDGIFYAEVLSADEAWLALTNTPQIFKKVRTIPAKQAVLPIRIVEFFTSQDPCLAGRQACFDAGIMSLISIFPSL